MTMPGKDLLSEDEQKTLCDIFELAEKHPKKLLKYLIAAYVIGRGAGIKEGKKHRKKAKSKNAEQPKRMPGSRGAPTRILPKWLEIFAGVIEDRPAGITRQKAIEAALAKLESEGVVVGEPAEKILSAIDNAKNNKNRSRTF